MIEAILQIKNEEELTEMMNNLSFSFEDEQNNKNNALFSLAGCLSNEEAEEIKTIIEDHFEKIDLNDWK